MPLMPKRVKYRKTQRGSRAGFATRTNKIDFGEYALQAMDRCWLKNTQIEAARVSINRNMKRKGKLWIRVFPDKSVRKDTNETLHLDPPVWAASQVPAACPAVLTTLVTALLVIVDAVMAITSPLTSKGSLKDFPLNWP